MTRPAHSPHAMHVLLRPLIACLVLPLLAPVASAFSGDLTYYGGAGVGGSCTSAFNYAGYTTVAMNNAQYEGGRACGACLHACFTANGQTRCFEAVVNNLCPECSYADLDLGEAGDGRWPVTWDYIPCPSADIQFSTQGSNPWYAKLKIDGAGVVEGVVCNGNRWSRSSDGYWIYNDPSGSLACGLTCVLELDMGRPSVTKSVPGSLFGSGGAACSG